jgi:Family of unknown function (DUF6962)
MKFMAYAAWMINHDDFIYVVFDSAPTMLLLLLLHGYSHLAHKDQGSIWIVSGVIVAGIAALVQVLKIASHAEFNHNDLFHVIQIASMILLYWGGRQLRTCIDNSQAKNFCPKIQNPNSLKP